MKKTISITCILCLLLISCNKNDDPDTSGTATINNELTLDPKLNTYIGYGFLFSKAQLVSIVDSPPPDITIENTGTSLILQTGNFKDSFYKEGEYSDAAAASLAFDNLKSLTVPKWESWGSGIEPNQIWIFKNSTEHYAKFRIVSTKSGNGTSQDYAECTFEWVYQPDGTLTFPGK